MPHTLIPHPSGRISFGVLTEMRAPGVILPAGEVHLFNGRHLGPNHGFGAEHIWAEHSREMQAEGFEGFADVAAYVATIIAIGTPVYFGDHNWRALRVMAV